MKIIAVKERFFEFRDAVSLNRVRQRPTRVLKKTDMAVHKSINADPGFISILTGGNDHAIV